MSANDDTALVALSKSGEDYAFEKLYLRYRSRLLKHISRILTSNADAEDVLQEAFLRAYRGIRLFKEESSFFTWIFSITLHCAFSSKRASNRGFAVMSTLREDNWDHIDTMLFDWSDPADEFEKQELLMELNKKLDYMDAIFADAFMLREIDGLSYNQIASIMQCSVGTVRSRLSRARHLMSTVVART